jgi:multiple antibiotic resistance protein
MSLPVSLGLWSDFVTPFVTVSPIETGAVFAAVTGGIHKASRKSLASRSVVIAGAMLLLFALCGNPILGILHISFPARSPEGFFYSSKLRR